MVTLTIINSWGKKNSILYNIQNEEYATAGVSAVTQLTITILFHSETTINRIHKFSVTLS